MKRISYLFSLLFLMSFVLFTSCKEEEVVETPLSKVNADKLAGTYLVTEVIRSDDAVVDLGASDVTLTLAASEDGLGGNFSSVNSAVLPGVVDLPASGTWKWPNATTFNRVIVNPGNISLNLTSALGASPLVFDFAGTDEKGDFTATVTATKQ